MNIYIVRSAYPTAPARVRGLKLRRSLRVLVIKGRVVHGEVQAKVLRCISRLNTYNTPTSHGHAYSIPKTSK